MKYVVLIYKIFLNLIQESVILQVCNSASFFSGCVHRDKSKCCIALATDAEDVRVFEKTLTGGFSCAKTRLTFDTEMLLNNNKNKKVIFDSYINGKQTNKKDFN